MSDLLRIDIEKAFSSWIFSSNGQSLRDECADFFGEDLHVLQNVDWNSISNFNEMKYLLNIACTSSDFNKDRAEFILVFNLNIQRDYDDKNILVIETNNPMLWIEPIREKSQIFLNSVADSFRDMLQTTGVKNVKRFEIDRVIAGEPFLMGDSTMQQDLGIEISIKKCLIK